MWHRVADIAKTHRVDESSMVEFANGNSDRFGVITEQGQPKVNTWYANDFVAAFKKKLNDS